jgi:hypothetical protein
LALLRDPSVVAAIREAVASASRAEWLTLDDAGKLAGVRARVLRDAARRGELEIGHAGRRPVVRREALDAWIGSRAARVVDRPRPENETSTALARAAARWSR